MSDEPLVAGVGPAELRGAFVRREVTRAAVWLGMASAILLAVLLVQPLLVILSAIVLASMLDGGVRLLGRVTRLARPWRLLIVVAGVVLFVAGTFYLTGVQVAEQVIQLRSTLATQAARLAAWLTGLGVMPGMSDIGALARQALGSVGKLTSFLGVAIGALTTIFMVLVLGLFLAIDPATYQRGLEWLVPSDKREEFGITLDRMGGTMRRLLAGRLIGMAAEGALTGIALMLGGVPMALLLGIITGTLAFIPNIGAFVSGVLMVAVGFSAGVDTGIWAIVTYVVVQAFDGYVLIPTVAKRTVDLPPALTLAAQILAGALFGVLGLMLADPITAMAKAALERRAEREAALTDEDVE